MYRLNYYFEGPSGQVIKMFSPSMQRRYDCEYAKENGSGSSAGSSLPCPGLSLTHVLKKSKLCPWRHSSRLKIPDGK